MQGLLSGMTDESSRSPILQTLGNLQSVVRFGTPKRHRFQQMHHPRRRFVTTPHVGQDADGTHLSVRFLRNHSDAIVQGRNQRFRYGEFRGRNVGGDKVGNVRRNGQTGKALCNRFHVRLLGSFDVQTFFFGETSGFVEWVHASSASPRFVRCHQDTLRIDIFGAGTSNNGSFRTSGVFVNRKGSFRLFVVVVAIVVALVGKQSTHRRRRRGTTTTTNGRRTRRNGGCQL
mmetsp:Transcript_133493/g.198458  ORF Transcript_133493/g.198458 Transcript_133493/m.198458 type:complete len:230 (-) Transcript_133493:140-829(-)